MAHATAPPKPPPATERGEGTRRQILELAAILIAERGYAGVSLNELVRRSGLTKGAFYFHFHSKADLAAQVFRYKRQQWTAHLFAAVPEGVGAMETLLRIPRAFVELYRADPAARAFQRMCMDLSGDPGFRKEMRSEMDGWEHTVVGLIEAAQVEGTARTDIDVRGVARTCVATFIGMEELSLALSDGDDLGDRVEDFLAFFQAALST